MDEPRTRRADLILGALAGIYFLLECLPSITGSCRYFIDEFYSSPGSRR
jgi:hypothetical protein